jgi:hypothetical protein
MPKPVHDDQYSDEETTRRFEAALRGAREVGHESMKDISPKRSNPLRSGSELIGLGHDFDELFNRTVADLRQQAHTCDRPEAKAVQDGAGSVHQAELSSSEFPLVENHPTRK